MRPPLQSARLPATDGITLYMEVSKLNVAVSRLRSRLGLALVVLAAAVAAAVLLNHSAPPSVADQNPNNTLCKGHINKGAADPNDPTSGTVAYTFACSQAISGYSILPDKAATGFETEVFGSDPATGEPLGTDAFSCNGEQPGFGVNCTGALTGNWHVVKSTFTIDGDVCAEPRVDPVLVVTFASVSGGKATQYIAGPFDLGRPRGCPKSARGGKTRIPADTTESTTGEVTPTA
jgi:hypothetical protein